MPCDKFADKYRVMLKDEMRKLYRKQVIEPKADAKMQAKKVLDFLFHQLKDEDSCPTDFRQEDFKVGKTMVFYRSEQHQQLEWLYKEAAAIVAATIQCAGRVLIAKKICAAKVERSNSFKTILNQAAKCSNVKSLMEILEPAKEQVQECTITTERSRALLTCSFDVYRPLGSGVGGLKVSLCANSFCKCEW
jgi:myosin heavy subunit